MINHKTVVVFPNDESKVIDLFKTFGWILVSRNEVVHTESNWHEAYVLTYKEAFNGTIYSRQVQTHFISLLFEIDTTAPNYEALQKDFSKYDQLMFHEKELLARSQITLGRGPSFGGYIAPVIAGSVMALIGITLIIAANIDESSSLMIIGILALILGLSALIIGLVSGINRIAVQRAETARCAENVKSEIDSTQNQINSIIEHAKTISKE